MQTVHFRNYFQNALVRVCNTLQRCVQHDDLPNSSMTTNDREVALSKMWAISVISTWKVDIFLETLSLAPTLANNLSTTPNSALCAGTKLPICRHVHIHQWKTNLVYQFLLIKAHLTNLCQYRYDGILAQKSALS